MLFKQKAFKEITAWIISFKKKFEIIRFCNDSAHRQVLKSLDMAFLLLALDL